MFECKAWLVLEITGILLDFRHAINFYSTFLSDTILKCMKMELKDQRGCIQNTQAVRVIDHVLSLLCCGRGHSSLTNIKILGDRLQQHGYLQRETWEKKHPITKDKILLLNWIKEHISPKTFQVKETLLCCVHDLKLLEGEKTPG